jgi:triphosphoribosyl-dephospho-CoA synthase
MMNKTSMTPQSLVLPVENRCKLNNIADLAIKSLTEELYCAPKPGLVTPFSQGSHQDMNVYTFLKSIRSLKSYFRDMAISGWDQRPFSHLQSLGISAERDMLNATNSINTHRGSIFSLGLLTAAAGSRLKTSAERVSGEEICLIVKHSWGKDLITEPFNSQSHGQKAIRKYKAKGARAEAADGFPILRDLSLPLYRSCIMEGSTQQMASIQTLMTLISEVDDTCLLHRGGQKGLDEARALAKKFIVDGAISQHDWRVRLHCMNSLFVQNNWSPGGSADLLACTLFLNHLETEWV